MRTLMYIPVIHTQADMGSLAPSVRECTIAILGTQKWLRNQNAIGQLWEHIRAEIARIDLPYPRVRLYQDAMPVCGYEVNITADLARGGSPNHLLLTWLIDKGATLMGTESPELLLQEYELAKEVLELSTGSDEGSQRKDRLRAASSALLEKRDRFISSRINSTLLAHETGLLFLGLLHSMRNWLDRDIKVLYPILPPSLDWDLLKE